MDESNDSRQERGGPLASFGPFFDEHCNIIYAFGKYLLDTFLSRIFFFNLKRFYWPVWGLNP